jgi:hypothetical protein
MKSARLSGLARVPGLARLHINTPLSTLRMNFGEKLKIYFVEDLIIQNKVVEITNLFERC